MSTIPSRNTAGHLASHDEERLVESDLGGDMDEPPDPLTPKKADFERRGVVHPAADGQESLLTKALRDEGPFAGFILDAASKRPSMASNISIASTAELTCDTGNTSPTRAPSPSPPHPGLTYLLSEPENEDEKVTPALVPMRPRRISFACAEPFKVTRPISTPPKAAEPARRSTIKFACPVLPKHDAAPHADANGLATCVPVQKPSVKFSCADKPCQDSVHSEVDGRALEPATVNPCKGSATRVKASKFLAATLDLKLEGSRFHEFASDEHQPDDWIIQDSSVPKHRLTMSDILAKELEIRKLGKEALEEEEEEDDDDLADEEELADIDEDDENEDTEKDCDDDDEDEDEDEDDIGDNQDDGYNTDSEHGFGDSDDEDASFEDEEEVEVDVPVRFPKPMASQVSPRLDFNHMATSLESNSSVLSTENMGAIPTHRMRIGRGKHLPDSADFVCGTFDEDRVVEDIYMTVVAARKQSKLPAVPQDIDPSFPASDPEDEDGYGVSDAVFYGSDEVDLGFGEFEDLNGADHVERRRRQSDACSPRTRCRSPPPKKHVSPPLKGRARSPRPLFGRTPSRRFHSPVALQYPKSPRASPVHRTGTATTCKPLASRPGLTSTKSLPRPSSIFPAHLKTRRKNGGKGGHRRGAIDIVKGLEQKRQRRREKYRQKYCDRTRKGQISEKKPVLPGEGVERMRELGLFMAGKRGPGYVLSF